MRQYSESFNTKMRELIRRNLDAEVRFEQVPLESRESEQISITNPHAISVPAELDDDILDMPRYITLEHGSWILNGSGVPRDGTEQVGYWSKTASNDNAEFTTDVIATITYDKAYDFVGITVAFDTGSDSYAVDFDLIAYNGTAVVKTIEVRDNKEAIYVSETPADGVTSISVKVYTWKHPYRYSKIVEFLGGIIRIFDGGDLVTPNMLEITQQFDPLSDQIPIGQCTFTIDNRDGRYNRLNPQGIWKYVEEGQEANTRIGFQSDKKQTGLFYIVGCKGSDGRAKFTAQDARGKLDTPFTGGFIDGVDWLTLAQEVMAQSGIEKYVLDSSLANYKSASDLTDATCRTVLRYIAAGAMMWVYVDADGVLYVTPPKTDKTGFTIDPKVSPMPEDETKDPIATIVCKYFTWEENNNGGYTRTDNSVEVSTGTEGGTRSVPDILLLNTEEQALAVAYFNVEYYKHRLYLNNAWRQNPAIEIADLIDVSTTYGTASNTVVTTQTIKYNGGITGTTKSELNREVT